MSERVSNPGVGTGQVAGDQQVVAEPAPYPERVDRTADRTVTLMADRMVVRSMDLSFLSRPLCQPFHFFSVEPRKPG